MGNEFQLKQTNDLCEDFAVMMHRFVCRMSHKGIEDPLQKIARKAHIPLKALRKMYLGGQPRSTIGDWAAVQWACREVLSKK